MGRMIARTAIGSAGKSPFAQTTKARSVKVKLNKKVLYELDGGDRKKVKAFKVNVDAGAISICVPAASEEASHANGFPRRSTEKTG
jgi:diacylglycerol kinase (ATP)